MGHPLMPLVSVRESDDISRLAQTLEQAGVNCLEIAFRTDFAPEAIRRITSTTTLRVFAGTLQSRGDVDTAIDAGAHGGLSPHLDREVLEYCRDRGFPFVPGIATPSEAARALRAGATTLKVFPVEQLGGPSLIAALNSVYPEAAFIVSGGISQQSVASYLEIDSVSSLSGSWMTPRSAIEREDFAEISTRVQQAVEAVLLCR